MARSTSMASACGSWAWNAWPGAIREFGMAEPTEWITHDHADLKHLNCVFTRVHWPQDKRVLDYCDRHGILMQTEVPAWGPDTFAGHER